LQHFVLLERRAQANVVLEKIFAASANRHFRQHRPWLIDLEGIAHLRIQEIVAGRRGIEGCELILRKSVQQVDPRKPMGIAIVDVGSQAVRRPLGDKRAVAEGGADKIVLAVEAPDPPPDAADILLREEFGANKSGIPLRVDDLVERTRAANRAGGKVIIALRAGKALEMKFLKSV